jgi:hypothetical protein
MTVDRASNQAHTEVMTQVRAIEPTADDDPEGTEYVADFADVPAADPSAEVDPNWLQLRANALLPALYMPPTMAGERSLPMRVVAGVLIGVFMFATTLGICLTYGPPT